MWRLVECSLCGKDFFRLNKAEIEGSILDVCDKCTRFGTKIEEPISYQPLKREFKFSQIIENTYAIQHYGQKILHARIAMGLTREDFARKIHEKESVIRRIEEEELEPDVKLLRKIQGFLRLKLVENISD